MNSVGQLCSIVLLCYGCDLEIRGACGIVVSMYCGIDTVDDINAKQESGRGRVFGAGKSMATGRSR